MMITKREKILGASVGVLLLGLALLWLVSSVMGAFESRGDLLTAAQSELDGKNRDLRKGKAAKARLDAWSKRSLSSDLNRAQTEYRVWLGGMARKAGFDLTVKQNQRPGEVYFTHSFTVAGKAEFRTLLQFLHDFYQVGYLHRVTSLTAKPVAGSKSLDISMQIDALSLNAAPEEGHETPPAREAPLAKDLAAYSKVILGRNFFGPPNSPPRFGSVGTPKGNPKRSMSFRVSASDPESDRLTYVLEAPDLPGAEIDSRSGEIRWMPEKLGNYEGLVRVTDEGNPPFTVEQRFRVAVVEPEVPRRENPWEKDDPARDARISGIAGPTENLQVWVTVPRGLGDQPKTLHLNRGEKISVGSFEGVVKEVRVREAEFELRDGRNVVIREGQPLVSRERSSGG
jgi:hypothetical protein